MPILLENDTSEQALVKYATSVRVSNLVVTFFNRMGIRDGNFLQTR